MRRAMLGLRSSFASGRGRVRRALGALAALASLAVPPPAARAADLVALPPQPPGLAFPTTDWPTADPPAAAAACLARELDRAFAEPDLERPVRTRAVVVVHGGRIVAERYGPGFTATTRLQGWSMTKSITNALVGILVRDKKLDVRAPAAVLEWQAPDDPRRAITLDVLLRASSGLEWSETYEASPLQSDVIYMLYRGGHTDMAAYAASKPLAHPVDTVWSYSSGTTLVISRLVRQVVGGGEPELRAFAREALFGPLGMTSAVLEADASGTVVGSSYSWATARDWARFGLLYLRDGVWDGKRILPEGWVDYSRTPTPAAPHGEYGAHFWTNAGGPGGGPPMPDAPRDLFFASGHDGQLVAIVPSRDLVVVRLGLTPSDGRFDAEGYGGAVAGCFAAR